MAGGRESSTMYMMALERLNKYFRCYNLHSKENPRGKLLHFTSRQFCNIPNLMKFYEKGSLVPKQFEEMRHNVEQQRDLKITCSSEDIVELQRFHSLEYLYIVGPCIRAVKGLRSASTSLKSLIVEKGVITANELLSLCCMDESRPMSWPCLLSLKISNCSLTTLDSSLKLLPNLQELDLSFNKLATTGIELCSLDQLTHLNLAFNRINAISQFHGGIRWQLQCLCLSYNELSSLEGLDVLENLIELDLSHNLLLKHDDLEPLRYLGVLQQLDLRGNPLSFNPHHRKLSLRRVSPQALKPNFVFDDNHLTRQDLEVGQYTPNAVSAQPYRFGAGEWASINSMEPEAYDVSMSSAANASGRQVDGDSYFKLCSQNQKKKRLASKVLVKIASPQPGSGDPFHSRAAGLKTAGYDFSPASKISADDTSSSVASTSASDGLLEPDRNESQGVTDEYLTLGGVTKVAGKDNTNSLHSTCQSLFDSEISSSIQDANTLDESTSSEKLDFADSIVPSMRVKRLSRSTADVALADGVEIFLTLTRTHLVESDVNGMIFEKLELGCVKSVTVTANKVMEVKFSYVTADRRTRQYVFDKSQALKEVNKLFGELDSVSLHNNKSLHKGFSCLKCSRRFSLAKNDPMVCCCGSDSVVCTDEQANGEKIFFLAEDEDGECHEAFESRIGKNEQSAIRNVSASINVCAPSIGNHASLSWIHAVHSVPDVARAYEQSLGMRGSDDSHLSESLPNDLTGVSLQPQYSNLRNTVSATVVNGAPHSVTPSKTFSHLLAPHPDLYKLVNVTSSMAAGRSKNITDLSVGPMSKSKLEDPESTPQAPKLPGETASSRHRQVMVTSTPRRKSSHANLETLGDSCPARSAPRADLPHRRRALAFDDVTRWADDATSGVPTVFDVEDHTDVGSRLKRFIDEELLEVEEDLISVFQTGLLYGAGTVLGNSPSLVTNGSKKGLFKSSKVSANPSPLSSVIDNEIVALLVLSTANIHILRATTLRNPTLPENLECFVSHPLCDVVGLDIGLNGFSVFVAFGSSQEVNKKFTAENIAEVFAFQFRDYVKCKRFYQCCKDLLTGNQDVLCLGDDDDSNRSFKANETNEFIEFSSPFSDFLEKSFSEDVLMHLDLHMTESQYQIDGLLKDELFSYTPCWNLDDETGKELSVAIVVSCGGSLCIVVEDTKQIMYEFVNAVVRTKRGRSGNEARSGSLSHLSAQTSHFGISSACIKARSGVHYAYEALTECSRLKNVVRFNDQPECLQLNFDPLKDLGCKHMWHLRFGETRSTSNVQRILEAYWKAENGSSLPVLWQ